MAISEIDGICSAYPKEEIPLRIRMKLQEIERINRSRFPLEAANLLIYYAHNNFRFNAVFIAIQPALYEEIYPLVISNIDTVRTIASNLFEFHRRRFEELFSGNREYLALHLLNYLSNSPEFDKYAPYFINAICMHYYLLNKDASLRFIEFLYPLIKCTSDDRLIKILTYCLVSLNNAQLFIRVINSLPKSSFKILFQDLHKRRSPLILDAIQLSDEDKFNCIDKLSSVSEEIIFSDFPPDKMFAFLLKLNRPRREKLYKARLLKNGLSVKNVIDELSMQTIWKNADKRQLAKIPPPMLVACYIPLMTILNFCPYMTGEQIRFIAFFGRKTATLAIYDRLVSLDRPYQIQHFKDALPEYPILHPHQLTKHELESRVKPI